MKRFTPTAYVVTMCGLAVYALGRLAPLPGVDQRMLSPLLFTSAEGILPSFGLLVPVLPAFGLGLGLLVFVRALAALLGAVTERPTSPGALAFAVYVALSVVQAAGVLFFLESASLAAEGGPSVAPQFDLAFRLVALATLVGGNVVLWVVASAISQKGIAHGPVLLFGVHAFFTGIDRVFAAGQRLASGQSNLLDLTWPALAVAALCVPLLTLWRWPAPGFPVPIRGRLAFLTPVDVVLLPPSVGAVLALPAYSPVGPIPYAPLYQTLQLFEPLLAAVAAVLLVLFWRSRVRGGTRRTAWLVSAIVAPFAALSVFMAGFAETGGMTRAFPASSIAEEGADRPSTMGTRPEPNGALAP